MADCRLYCLDGAGQISMAENFEASDDADAIEQARERKRHTLKCEIWEGPRLVTTLNAQDLAS